MARKKSKLTMDHPAVKKLLQEVENMIEDYVEGSVTEEKDGTVWIPVDIAYAYFWDNDDVIAYGSDFFGVDRHGRFNFDEETLEEIKENWEKLGFKGKINPEDLEKLWDDFGDWVYDKFRETAYEILLSWFCSGAYDNKQVIEKYVSIKSNTYEIDYYVFEKEVCELATGSKSISDIIYEYWDNEWEIYDRCRRAIDIIGKLEDDVLHKIILYRNIDCSDKDIDDVIGLLELFIDAGADVNAKDYDGDTPLHLAVECRDYEIIKFLIENGADPTIKNKENKTPLDIVKNAPSFDEEFIKLLEEALEDSEEDDLEDNP